MKRFFNISLAVLASILLLSSCAKESSAMEEFADGIYSDLAYIRGYLKNKGQDSGVVIHPSGLVYKVLEPGNGRDFITLEQTPTLIFEEKLMKGDEKVIESSLNTPTKFDGRKLKDHILGWQIGLPLISKGGHIILYIPSSLAFGKEGVPNVIPPNAILICDIKLIDFE